jgi:hypothetical protein
MTLLWALFGAAAGASHYLVHGGNLIAILSGAIAGVLVMPVLGVPLALLGGQVKPTLLGGIWGAALGVLAGFVAGPSNAPVSPDFGLLVGGMAGATFPQMLRSTALLARSVLRLQRGQ